ncbi:hypothetical protein BZL30_8310 [Mycobacterium kansasii]|uniref:Uncharacterized protein n=1 Tax=Mycobacterium kansasii TaxID=1768 RepID=A0A1V3WKH8_MYCKA|nr:hypothetical protein BZL30_8310 [Mycobacterium kansasii]
MIGFFRALAAEHPGLLGQRYLAVGSARARMNALGRHVVYRWLGRRMHPAPPAADSQHDASKTG